MPDDLTDGTTDGGALRKQLEKALADLKTSNEQNTKLAAQLRSTSVKDLFGALKADPRGAKFYTGEPTEDALKEWLKADGDVFATAPAATPETPATPVTPGTPATPAVQLPPGITPEMLAAAQVAAGMVPQTPAAPTGDLATLTEGLNGLAFDKPEDGAKIAATFQAIRAQAAAALANGGSL